MSDVSDPLSLLIAGPDPSSCDAIYELLSRRFDPLYRAAEPVPSGQVSLGISSHPIFPIGDTLIQLQTLSGEAFPGELLSLHLQHLALVFVLPLPVYEALPRATQLAPLLALFRQVSLLQLSLVVDVGDADEVVEQLAAEEVSAQLVAAGWAEGEVSVLCGDVCAWEAAVELTHEPCTGMVQSMVEQAVGYLASQPERPFLLHVEDRFNMAGHQSVVTGYVKSGAIEVGEQVVSFGDGLRMRRVAGIEIFRKLLDRAERGDSVGLLLDHTGPDDVRRGHILTKALESVVFRQQAQAFVHFRSRERGGASAPFALDAVFSLYMGTHECLATMVPVSEEADVWGDSARVARPVEQRLVPGMTCLVTLVFEAPFWCERGVLFPIRYDGSGVGVGVLVDDGVA